MDNNNPISHQLQSLIEQRRPTTRPQSLDQDEATAELLTAIAGHDTGILPAEVWKSLQRRNEALLSQPREEILKSLARQSSLLESLINRYTAQAVTATKPSQGEGYMRLALSCNRALVSVWGAVHAVSETAGRNASVVADDEAE